MSVKTQRNKLEKSVRACKTLHLRMEKEVFNCLHSADLTRAALDFPLGTQFCFPKKSTAHLKPEVEV